MCSDTLAMSLPGKMGIISVSAGSGVSSKHTRTAPRSTLRSLRTGSSVVSLAILVLNIATFSSKRILDSIDAVKTAIYMTYY